MLRRPRSIRHLLQDKPELKRLEREIRVQKTLLSHLRQCLPADIAAHCLHAQLHDETLVIHTDSPVWATRLRYLAPQLIDALAVEYPGLRAAKVRLAMEAHRPKSVGSPPHHSNRAAEIIHSSAGHTKSESLQKALRRLGEALKAR